MSVCAACTHEARDGYKIDPETGRICESSFWCRACYEAIAARGVRNTYTPCYKKRPDDAR